MSLRDFPGGPVVRTSCSQCRAQFQSLVRKLRSHVQHNEPAHPHPHPPQEVSRQVHINMTKKCLINQFLVCSEIFCKSELDVLRLLGRS